MTTLHDKIMRMTDKPGMYVLDHEKHVAYKEGARDIRHAAAELALEHDTAMEVACKFTATLNQENVKQRDVMAQLVDALKLLRNHTSVNFHQIAIIDAALAHAKELQA